MNTELFVKPQNPIKRVGSSSLDELRVSTDQCKGGYNCAYDKYEESGIKVSFTPIEREINTYITTLIGDMVESGLKVHVANAKRKSLKKIDKVANEIKPLLDKFGEIWRQNNAKKVEEAEGDVRK